jgi:predicted DNA-binding transcriptional regulator AlpA
MSSEYLMPHSAFSISPTPQRPRPSAGGLARFSPRDPEDIMINEENLRWCVENLGHRVDLLERELRERQPVSPYLTRHQAAAFLQISLSSVDNALAAGRLPKRMFAGSVRILRSDLESAMKVVDTVAA